MNENIELFRIFQGLRDGSFPLGKIIRYDIFEIEIQSKDRIKITFDGKEPEIWRRKSKIGLLICRKIRSLKDRFEELQSRFYSWLARLIVKNRRISWEITSAWLEKNDSLIVDRK